MTIEFTGRKVEITPAIRRFTEDKLKKLTKLLDGAVETHVILTVEKHRHSAEIVVHTRHETLSASETTSDLYASIGKVLEKIGRQAKKHKEMTSWGKKKVKGVSTIRAVRPLPAEPRRAGTPRVVRARRYAVKPMVLEEALLQFNGSADTFLVFRDAGSERVSILYRRADGNFGLIEPEI